MRVSLRRWLLGSLQVAALLVIIPALAHTSQAPAPPAPAPPPTTRLARVSFERAPDPTATPTPPPTPSAVPTPELTAAGAPPYLPILMYHYIREVDEALDPLGFRLSVRPERFDEQLAWLRENGYQTLRMRDLAACLRAPGGCPAQAVVLTFDDGYVDNALVALPALERHGFTATFFIVSGLVGEEGYMSWAQLEQLRDSGMEIGAHTVSHADLTALDPAQARAEMADSLRELERRLAIEVVSFSYPSGSYTPELALLARDAGFTSAVTTEARDSLERLYELPRRRVLGGETIEGFEWYFVPPSRLAP